MQRIAVAALGPVATAYARVTRRYDARVATCSTLPRVERHACRDQAEARYVMATEALEEPASLGRAAAQVRTSSMSS